jgi:hypothetical protein
MGIILSARYKKGDALVSEVSVNNYTNKTLSGMKNALIEWDHMHPSGSNPCIKEDSNIATLSIEFDMDDDFHSNLFGIFATNVIEAETAPPLNRGYVDDDDDSHAY